MSTAILYNGDLIADTLVSINGNKRNFPGIGRLFPITLTYSSMEMKTVVDTDENGNEYVFRESVPGEVQEEKTFYVANLGTPRDRILMEMILKGEESSLFEEASEEFAGIIYSPKDKVAHIFHQGFYPMEIKDFSKPIVVGTGSAYVEGAFEAFSSIENAVDNVSAVKLMSIAQKLDHDTSTECEIINMRGLRPEIKRLTLN